MAKSKARFLGEILGSDGKIEKAKTDAAVTAGPNLSLAADGTLTTTTLPLSGGTLTGLVQSNSTIQTTANIKVGGYLLFDGNDDFTGSDYYTIQDDVSTDVLRIGRNFNTTDCLELNSTGDLHLKGGNLTVSGNIIVGGTVDGVDIAARDAVLTSTTTTAGAALPKAGGTMTGTLAMGANAITSTGSISSGAITLDGSQGVKVIQNQQIQNPPSNEADFYQGIGFRNTSTNHAFSIGYGSGGKFVLNYFDNSTTYSRLFDISSTGNATFTGNISSGNITSSGQISATTLNATNTGGYGTIEVGGSSGAFIDLKKPASDDYDIRIVTDAGTGGRIQSNGVFDIDAVGDITLDADGGDINLKDNGTSMASFTTSAATFAGNILVSGTVDGVDIAARDAVLTSTTTTANAALPKAGGTMTGNLAINSGSPELYFGTTGNHYNWRIAAQELVNEGFEIAVGSQDTDYSNDTYVNKFVVKASGNVGIGTNSPQDALDLYDADDNVGIYFHTATSGVGGGDGLRVGLNNTHAFVWNYENTPISFGTNGSQKATILANGNVGIGESNPATKLDVAGLIKVAENSNTAFYGGDYVRVFGSGQEYGFRNSGGATKANISMSGNSYFNGGNVGIGTSSPTAKLQISYNGGHTSGNVALANSSLDLYNPLAANTDEKGSVLTFSDNYFGGSSYSRTTRAAIKGGTDTVGNTADGFLAFYTDSGGANSMPERMRINHDGYVGIGTDCSYS